MVGSAPALRAQRVNAWLVIADNKLALNAAWDCEVLALELQALIDLPFDVEITGFSLAEVDLLIEEIGEAHRIQRKLPKTSSCPHRSGVGRDQIRYML